MSDERVSKYWGRGELFGKFADDVAVITRIQDNVVIMGQKSNKYAMTLDKEKLRLQLLETNTKKVLKTTRPK